METATDHTNWRHCWVWHCSMFSQATCFHANQLLFKKTKQNFNFLVTHILLDEVKGTFNPMVQFYRWGYYWKGLTNVSYSHNKNPCVWGWIFSKLNISSIHSSDFKIIVNHLHIKYFTWSGIALSVLRSYTMRNLSIAKCPILTRKNWIRNYHRIFSYSKTT